MTIGSAFGPAASPCPCGAGQPYAACCGPLHHGETAAVTAEQLMRSRYSAFAVGDGAYLLRTWHRRTRPETLSLDSAWTWTRLEILRTERGGPRDEDGVVEFRAHHRPGGSQHEVSRFLRVGRQWFYLDALA